MSPPQNTSRGRSQENPWGEICRMTARREDGGKIYERSTTEHIGEGERQCKAASPTSEKKYAPRR